MEKYPINQTLRAIHKHLLSVGIKASLTPANKKYAGKYGYVGVGKNNRHARWVYYRNGIFGLTSYNYRSDQILDPNSPQFLDKIEKWLKEAEVKIANSRKSKR